MKKLLLSLAVLSCVMGSVFADELASKEAELQQVKAEDKSCEERIAQALKEKATLAERVARVESDVARLAEAKATQDSQKAIDA